jgi:hypothetical protein
MIGVLMLVAIGPALLRGRPHYHYMSEAQSNARQIGLALFEFDNTYGKFPDASTIPMVREAFPSSGMTLGTSTSNDFFRQLMAADIAQTEMIFYARTLTGKKPDNLFTGGKALEKGECAFAYIAGLSSSEGSPDTPLVVFPLVPGKQLFDYKWCKEYAKGKAIILRLDNSVTSLPVDKSGHVYLNGKDLFDPSQPFWGGKAPDVKWPE